MITKVCIDNFRCFTNFELELDSFNLLFGGNGSGKSSLFDVLGGIQSLLLGLSVGDCFFGMDRTAWDTRTKQDFAVEMQAGDDSFRYELSVEHSPDGDTRWIARERLLWNSHILYRFEGGEVRLYSIVGSDITEGASFPFDSSRSFIPLLPERQDNQPLYRFRNLVDQWLNVRLVPPNMDASSKEQSYTIDPEGQNFSSWYLYLATAHPEITAKVIPALQEAIPGIQHLRLAPAKEGRWFEAVFENVDRPLAFFQLSDGQRALIVLYTLLHSVPSLGYTLLIDEPDNYISLREIQPWLLKLEGLCIEQGRQAILISHHPEIINPLAKDRGIWFTRPSNGAVKAIRGYPVVDGLTAAETMARGWDDE